LVLPEPMIESKTVIFGTLMYSLPPRVHELSLMHLPTGIMWASLFLGTVFQRPVGSIDGVIQLVVGLRSCCLNIGNHERGNVKRV